MDRGYESFGLLEVTVEQLYVSSYTLIRLTILADQGDTSTADHGT